MERMKMSQGKQCLKSTHVKRSPGDISPSWRAKDEMLEVEAYLEMNMAVCQGMEKDACFVLWVNVARRSQAPFKELVESFFSKTSTGLAKKFVRVCHLNELFGQPSQVIQFSNMTVSNRRVLTQY